MIGLSAETTGLPPTLRVPARQHLQHTHPSPYSSKLAPSYPMEMVPVHTVTYVHTAGFDNKLEPGVETGVTDAHWHWSQFGTGSSSGSGFRGLLQKNVRTSKLQEKPLPSKEKIKNMQFSNLNIFMDFLPTWIQIRIQTPKSLRRIRIYNTARGKRNLVP
jgi:hypothetical protein